ncbi:hypothetical protein Tco_1415518 [Tanacetum coccineum]
MDRTSILGDTIDYMKELLEKIQDLKEQAEVESDHVDQLKMEGSFREFNMNESQVIRNPPKDPGAGSSIDDKLRRDEANPVSKCWLWR